MARILALYICIASHRRAAVASSFRSVTPNVALLYSASEDLLRPRRRRAPAGGRAAIPLATSPVSHIRGTLLSGMSMLGSMATNSVGTSVAASSSGVGKRHIRPGNGRKRCPWERPYLLDLTPSTTQDNVDSVPALPLTVPSPNSAPCHSPPGNRMPVPPRGRGATTPSARLTGASSVAVATLARPAARTSARASAVARPASPAKPGAAECTTPKRKRFSATDPTTGSIDVGSVVSVQNKVYEGYLYRVSGYGSEAIGKRMVLLEFMSFDEGSEAAAAAETLDDDAEVPERLLRLVSARAVDCYPEPQRQPSASPFTNPLLK